MDITPSHECLHAFCVRPGVTFESQRPNEEVILVLRAHPYTQFFWLFNTVILVVLLILADIFLPSFFTTAEMIYLNIAGVVIIFSYIWMNVLHWFFNVGIITNERIIDIDFYNALYKEISATKLEKVSDVTAKIGGFFGSFFQYGDVLVETEGHIQSIEFDNVPQPERAVSIINDLMKPN